MEPLKQFICDVCGETIEKVEDGYVVWKTNNDHKITDMQIIHHADIKNPKIGRGCDTDNSFTKSFALEYFLGNDGRERMLSMLDPGERFNDEYEQQFEDMRLFTEYFRRFQCPHYEEARIYWSKAEEDGYFSGAGEVWPYLQRSLKELIRQYKK